MWELALIAKDFQPRRKAIYQDIDRKDGPMWSQVYKLCLDVVNEMETRIDSYGKAPEPTKDVVPATKDAKDTIPASRQISNEQILLATPSKKSAVENIVDKLGARSPGQAPSLSPIVQKSYGHAKGLVGEVARQATSPDELQSPIQQWTRRFLASPVGAHFRQTFNQRLSVAVLGTPHAEPSLFVNSISALTRLAVKSLAEDNYGNVQRDVATIIRVFTAATLRLEKFKVDFPVHWTDLDASKDCAAVDAILESLKDALGQLIESFGPYARDIRLTFADMRQAREAAGIPSRSGTSALVEAARPEMRQVR